MRPFRWVPYSGSRHAVAVDLAPGARGETLCGEELNVPYTPLPSWPHGTWPECSRCDDHWRDVEGIPRRSSRTRT